MAKKNYEEQLKKTKMQIAKLQKEKRCLERKKKDEFKKHRDHIMIVIGTTFMTHYSEADNEKILNQMSDDEVRAWIHAKFKSDT